MFDMWWVPIAPGAAWFVFLICNSLYGRYGPIKPVAALAVDLLDTGVGWSSTSSGLSHPTGMTVFDSGGVMLLNEHADTDERSRNAVKRALARCRKREADERMLKASRAFADNIERYTQTVVKLRKNA